MGTDRSRPRRRRARGRHLGDASLIDRARAHAALGDPVRLAVVDELAASDRSPSELADRLGLAGNLLAHHLDTLESAGLIERVVSSGDRRRRYVRLRGRVGLRNAGPGLDPRVPMLFVCTRNSARSQLAAAIWRAEVGRRRARREPTRLRSFTPVRSPPHSGRAWTSPRWAPCAVAPEELDASGWQVVTVCDQAHEQLDARPQWWHWSITDPVAVGTPAAFDGTLDALAARIATLR